jgi:D-xylose transport system substrate-binding protein
MTVYTAIKLEAYAAAELAIALANGDHPDTGQTVTDSETGEEIPAVLLEPQAIFQDNVADVVDDGYVTVEELCVDEYADLCDEAGIS